MFVHVFSVYSVRTHLIAYVFWEMNYCKPYLDVSINYRHILCKGATGSMRALYIFSTHPRIHQSIHHPKSRMGCLVTRSSKRPKSMDISRKEEKKREGWLGRAQRSDPFFSLAMSEKC